MELRHASDGLQLGGCGVGASCAVMRDDLVARCVGIRVDG